MQDAKSEQAHGTRLIIERAIILALLGGLLAGVALILRPFVTAILFGGTLAIAAWPLRALMVRHGVRPGLAASLLLGVALVVIVVPIVVLVPSLSQQVATATGFVHDFTTNPPPAPAFLARIPLVGSDLESAWTRIIDGQGDFRTLVAPYAETLRGFMLDAAKALADSVLQLVLSLIVATMFWASGDTLGVAIRDILDRLGGKAATRSLEVAVGAVAGVAYGVVGTAVVQSAVMAVGLAIAGVPGVALLSFLTLLFAISQIGAVLMIFVWGGAAWWLLDGGATGWAVFMVVWGLFVGTVDNFVRPWLISFGVKMPLALVILGVFGGFVSFGFLGLFIGPSLLAVLFTLLDQWRRHGDDRVTAEP
ncbi:AI-2E family transporter [Blastochloris sulfoviridis]|uniref:AI-2E family transporter n=1 Tax=Blastochloris sulfoviridis TaxID=50712 RepID=A0A5M6I2X3_9HYPH|nr:AI-2E family transporter [Blastochloris sulfoviridis]KAA5602546.1 AI-2E family transporter [Blastochloris sulfoviridis]